MILTFKNKTKNQFKNILLFILISLFFSCTNSYDLMIDSFNRKYFLPEGPEDDKYSVLDPDFNPYEMLSDSYVFKDGYYINLDGPADAATYLWTISDIEDSEESVIEVCNKQNLYCKTSDVFTARHSYKLVLTITVTKEEGAVVEYIDKSTITIIDQN